MNDLFVSRMLFAALASWVIGQSVAADTVTTLERTTTKIADGVYVIRHPDAPDTFPQGNTTVIIGDRECLVIDSCFLPSSAKEDIAQIRQWTNKPVRYLLNTHWHLDHNNGNALYAKEFPGLGIIAHFETAKMIRSYNPMVITTYATRTERFKRMLDTGKDEEGKDVTDATKADIVKSLKGIDQVVAEFKDLPVMPPNLTFDRALDLDLGKREVQIRFLGRGNTAGDVIAYLPAERIATLGDLLDHPVPYFYGGFPVQLMETLRALAQFDVNTFIPGHGEVMRDKKYLVLVSAFLEEIVPLIQKRVNSSRDTEEQVAQFVKKSVNLGGWKEKFCGNDKENGDAFDQSVDSLIDVAYKEAKLR